MSILTKVWLYLCAIILWSGAWWCAGYHAADASWEAKDTKRKLVDAKAAKDISEKHRAKEQELNERIGTIETKAINDSADAEAKYRDVIDRLRNARAHPTDGLRVKPALTCSAVSGATTSASNGHAEIQTGLSTEVAERIIGVGTECDKVVMALDACQSYIESIRNEKPLE